MPFQVKVGAQPEEVEREILTDELLDQVIEEHQLLKVWDMPDNESAKARIRQKFRVFIDGAEVRVTYQDKDKELTQSILHSIANGFIDRMRKAHLSAPESR